MATNTKEFRVKNGLEISSGPIKINGSSGSSGQVLSSTGSGVQWIAPTTGSGTGDVVGPASSTINAVVRFDGTTGKLIKNSSGVTIDDSSNITTSGSLTVSGNATFDTNTLFVDATNDRVGVGTVSPSYKLDVRGMARIQSSSGYNVLFETWNTNERVNFMNDAGSANISAVFRATDYAWQNGGGSDILKLDSSGNLGVGTSSPDGKLEVSGKLKVRGTTSANDLVQVWGVSGGSGSYSTLELIKTADTSGNFIFRGFTAGGTGTAPKIAFGNWSATPFDGAQMTLDTSSGNLGVGTASPSERLSIKSATGINSVTDIASFSNPSQTSAGVRVLFNNGYGKLGAISSFQLDNGAGADNGVLAFQTASDAVLSTKMTILDTGAVGMGTVSPSAKLDVVGTSFFLRPSSVNAVGHFDVRNDTASPVSVRLAFGTDNTGWQMRFAKNYQGTYTDYMTINDVGNIGIGTSSPAHKLDVSGKTRLGNGATQGAPSTSNIGTNAELLIGGTGGNYLAIGQYDSSSSYAHWIQSAYEVPSTAIYNMVLQPLGGNVGISNTAPSQKLDINGNIRLYGSSNNVYLLLRNNHQSIWGARVLCWDYGDGQGINFETSDNTDTWGTRMVVRHNGNVGISTTAPAFRLDVNGSGNFNGVLNIAYGTGISGADQGLAIYHGSNSGGYGRIRFYENNSNTSTIHNFSTTWQGGSSGTINTNSTGCINLDGPYGVTIGAWNSPTASFNRATGLATFNGAVSASGAITQGGNQVLHAGNYSSYAIPNSGSWLGDLGSYGFTRYAGMSMSGGSEVVFLYKGGQGYTLIDGNYMAFEGGGFYSSYNSSGGTLLGMKAIATNTLELTARTSIRRSAYTVGASDFFMELTAPDDGSGNGEIGLRFHLEGRYWRQIRANSGGFKFTQGSNNDTVNVTAYDVIAQNDVSASRYVNSVYFNQSSGNSENPTIGQIWTQNTTDNYCRKSTPAHFKAQMGMYHNDGTSTANRIIISTGTPTGTITNGDVWLQY